MMLHGQMIDYRMPEQLLRGLTAVGSGLSEGFVECWLDNSSLVLHRRTLQ